MWAATCATPLSVIKKRLQSSSFEHLFLREQSRDDPEIVTEHAPGDGEVAVVEATFAQASSLTLFEDRDS